MKPLLYLALPLLVGISLAPVAAAQQDDQLLLVSTYTVEAHQIPAFGQQVDRLVEAARQAELTQDFGWFTYTYDNKWVVVSPLPSLAVLDDPMAWMRQFEGTPGEATLQTAFEAMGRLNFTWESAIIESVADWQYMPAEEGPWRYAVVYENTLAPGAVEEFGSVMTELVSLAGQIDYPFRFDGNRPRIGPGTHSIVFFVDDLSRFFEEYTGPAVMERYPQTAPALGRLFGMTRDQTTTIARFEPSQSYWPPMLPPDGP